MFTLNHRFRTGVPADVACSRAGCAGAMGGDRCAGHRAVDSGSADHATAIGHGSQSTAIDAASAAGHDRRPRHGTLARAAPCAITCPSNWTQVTSALQGQRASGYSALSADVQQRHRAPMPYCRRSDWPRCPSADQQQIQAARQWSAMQQALAQQALANASNRFAAIQSLIAAISTAADQKGILDLQARISAELGMLQNEQTKIQVLYQATQAQESANRQQAREHAIDDQGRFETAFSRFPDGSDRESHGILRNILALAQRAARRLHRRQHGAPGVDPRARRCHAGDDLRDGVGLLASHRQDRGAVPDGTQAHRRCWR